MLSHWFLDLIVHRPDLPLYDNVYKVGFGLWNHAWLSFLLMGIAVTALISYFAFTGVAAWLERARA